MRKKIWSLVNAYESFNERYPDEVSKKLYMKLMSEFFWEMSILIIREKYQFKLPKGLGIIRIRKHKNRENIKNNRIDYGYFNKTGKVVKHLNSHSDGYYFRFNWTKKVANFTNKSLYGFVPIRGNDQKVGARGLAKYIKDCAKDPYVKDYDCSE